jgi:hypothetical protein
MRFYIFIFIALSGSFLSCNKPGTGGKAKLNIHVMREATGTVVPGAVVYIKYGASEFPGADPSYYDDQRTADNSGKCEFEGLRRGTYYLYATGIDPATSAETTGGVAFDIRNKIGERDIVIETKP